MATNLGAIVPCKTAAEWATTNPLVPQGQLAYESDTHALKVGDGTARYTDLPYAGVIAGTSSAPWVGTSEEYDDLDGVYDAGRLYVVRP